MICLKNEMDFMPTTKDDEMGFIPNTEDDRNDEMGLIPNTEDDNEKEIDSVLCNMKHEMDIEEEFYLSSNPIFSCFGNPTNKNDLDWVCDVDVDEVETFQGIDWKEDNCSISSLVCIES